MQIEYDEPIHKPTFDELDLLSRYLKLGFMVRNFSSFSRRVFTFFLRTNITNDLLEVFSAKLLK